jgi:enamine deaminase RidA (YjgF/YER057c/UK114 family)
MLKRYDGDGRMSKAVVHNETVYLRGLTIADKTMDITAQTEAVLAMVEELLEEHGSDKNHILSALIHLKEIALFDKMNLIWDSWIENGHEPGRTCVEAIMSHDDILVEVTIVAAVK